MATNGVLADNVTHTLKQLTGSVTNNNDQRVANASDTKQTPVITSAKDGNRILPSSEARRCARGRERVKNVSNGFATLREHVLAGEFGVPRPTKKLSQLEIIKLAIEYIRDLENVLDNDDTTSQRTSLSLISTTTPESVGTSASEYASKPSSDSTTYSEPSSPMDDRTTIYADENIMEAIDWWDLC